MLHALVRRVLPPSRLIPHHDVAGFLVAIVGVLYAVVIGFLVVTVWSSFASAQSDADLEAYSVADAFAFAGALPEPQRTQIRGLLVAYAHEVRTVEWTRLSNGRDDPRARTLFIAALRELAQAPVPRGQSLGAALREQSLFDIVIDSLRQAWGHRRSRLSEANENLAPALYLALTLGALIVLGFVFLFGVENRGLQLTMTALVAGCIGLLFGVIVEFSQPYSGLVRVSPAAWDRVINAAASANAVR